MLTSIRLLIVGRISANLDGDCHVRRARLLRKTSLSCEYYSFTIVSKRAQVASNLDSVDPNGLRHHSFAADQSGCWHSTA